MKIFFIISRLDRGGAQRVFLNLINYMSNKLDSTYDINLILFKSNPEDSYLKNLSRNCNVLCLNSSAKLGWFKLLKILKNHNPDIIFSTLNYINISALIAVLLSRSKAKLILREAIPLSTVSQKIILLQKLLYFRADRFWAITPVIANELSTKMYINKSKIFTIPNPLEIDKKNDSNDFFPGNHNLKKKRPLKILYVGRLIKRKCADDLINALKLIENQNWELEVIGAGPEMEALKNLVFKLDLNKKVFIRGFKENPYEYMMRSDIFCLPSLYEGLPNVLIEAMRFNNVCLANDTEGGGVKYINKLTDSVEILDFKNYKLVARRLLYYINNPERLDLKKKQSNIKSKFFDVENIYNKFIKNIIN